MVYYTLKNFINFFIYQKSKLVNLLSTTPMVWVFLERNQKAKK